MTVSRTLSSLNIFQSKVEEAVNLVPAMCAEDKLKAVQFWNTVSEKLQDIVNNSVTDINVAFEIDEDESAKMNLGTSSQNSHTGSGVHNIDAIISSSNCVVNSDPSVQYHSSISNNQSKSFISSSLRLSNSNKQSSFDEVTYFSYNQQFLLSNSNHSNVCTGLDQTKDINNCSNSMDTQGALNDLPFTEVKRESFKNGDKTLEVKEASSSSVIMESKDSKTSEVASVLHQEVVCQNDREFNLKIPDCHSGNVTKEQTSSIQSLDTTSEPSLESIPDLEVPNSQEMYKSDEGSQSMYVNPKNSLTCKVCSKSFQSEELLTRHHLRTHERHFNCSECKAKFSTKSNLLVHMRRHTGERPFCCHKCSAHFTTNGNLQRHIRTHSGAKPWQCAKCGTCFTEKKSLTIHMRRHTGERPYQCKECGKRFSQSSILQTHMAMHLGTKMHLCEVCGKSFRQKSQLRVHKLRHDDIRAFKCSNATCSLSFLTRGDLLRHEKTHTLERPYKCDMCPKGFTRQQSLNEHKNRHYGIKPYKCKYCGKAFPEMSGCYKHMKYHERANDKGDSIKEKDNEDSEPVEITTEIDSSVSIAPNIEEKKPSNVTEAPSYIAVVLNAKDPAELGNEINQAVSFFNSGLEENNLVPNGIGVLTAINILTNTSSFPQNFQNIS